MDWISVKDKAPEFPCVVWDGHNYPKTPIGILETKNCRWITNAQNMDNTRRTRRYEYNGENLTLREWSNKTGLSRDLLSNRINGLGWSVEKAITTPVKEKYRHLVAKERKEKSNERN